MKLDPQEVARLMEQLRDEKTDINTRTTLALKLLGVELEPRQKQLFDVLEGSDIVPDYLTGIALLNVGITLLCDNDCPESVAVSLVRMRWHFVQMVRAKRKAAGL